MFFELEISYAVSEVNKRYELRKFLRIDEEVKLKSVYSFMSKIESVCKLFSILNANSKRRRKLILYWMDVSLDLNPLRRFKE